ncbi:HNH endonuclease [Alkalihalophilus marmarensis]|uniref:HNH endonuclease n=1 Tax=Alkalihalophilus marmarensis TaxID=521377 RepID=UPI002DB7A61A|nr:HNH endonuclease signature motif containing protein [Alkalihalophilus marmarensis]MEC2072496.1 HNH endonuclease signature motif containing protein [Alkalihalophilus marmarensis]
MHTSKNSLVEDIDYLIYVLNLTTIPGFEDVFSNGKIKSKLNRLQLTELEVLFEIIMTKEIDQAKLSLINNILLLVDSMSYTSKPLLKSLDILNANQIELVVRSTEELVMIQTKLAEHQDDKSLLYSDKVKMENEDIARTTINKDNMIRNGRDSKGRNKIYSQAEPVIAPSENNEKLLIIDKIMLMVEEVKINIIPGFEEVELFYASKEDLLSFSLRDLKIMYDYLVSPQNQEKFKFVQKIISLKELKGVDLIPGFEDINLAGTSVREDLLLIPNNELKLMQKFLEELDHDGEREISERINRILTLAREMNITDFPDLGINFAEVTEMEMQNIYTQDDQAFFLETLEKLKKEGFKQTGNLINPLEIINKYKNGAIVNEEELKDKDNKSENWRREIPQFIKYKIPSWKSESLDTFYDKAKDLMNSYKGKDLEFIRSYVCDLSEEVYANEQEEDEELLPEDADEDDVGAAVLALVEMIILPHIEVLEKIEQKGGQILFSDIWNQPFNDSLKNRVKDRDEWSCVICESDKGLHVHHKIPRKYGGVNHMDNLVTLCDSCHPSIETADIRHAYTKCLANFKMNRYNKLNKPVSSNKSQLKKEVEMSLDHLFLALSNRNENQLVDEVLGVIKKLEIIFND